MKTFRSKTGPFGERPFYQTSEIEAISAQELRKVGLYPVDPEPIRIDRFVEKRFKIQPTYEDLPRGLLGFTRFGAKGVEAIVVARSLDEEGTTTAERRVRTTLAHEAGHGLLHVHLFAAGSRPDSLFGDALAPDAPKILCRDPPAPDSNAKRQASPDRWWEYQANQIMGALLLPKTLVEKALSSILKYEGKTALPTLAADQRENAARVLADTFNVNPVVARIRLEGLFPAAAGRQLTL